MELKPGAELIKFHIRGYRPGFMLEISCTPPPGGVLVYGELACPKASRRVEGTIMQVEMINSTTNANIQIADWVTGALARYLEKKELGEECYQILKNNLLSAEGKELFKN